MCGDTGIGGMAEVDTIVQMTLRSLNPWDPYSPPNLKRQDRSKRKTSVANAKMLFKKVRKMNKVN